VLLSKRLIPPKMQIDIFISYSHQDEVLHGQLAKHLKPLEHEGLIRSWYDRQILPGEEFEAEISSELNAASVILLLISPDFISSEYCWGTEMKRAMERHEARTARVIPVILRPIDWRSTPFGKLLALPRDGKPITTWPNQDEALLDVARGIRSVVTELNSSPSGTETASSVRPGAKPADGHKDSPAQPPATDSRVSVARVHLSRMTRVVDKLRMYKIRVDGAVVGEIADGQTTTFKVNSGQHSITLTIDWCSSNTLSFEAQGDEDIHLECGNNSALRAIWAPHSYVYLKRV